MTQEEIKELDKYFNCYSTRKYYSAFYYPKTEEEREVCRHMSHKEHDFHIIVFDQNMEVYQLNSDHEIQGIELLNLDKLRIRFESFTGEQLENVPEENVPQAPTKFLTYNQRVELLNQKRLQEAQAAGQKFISPGVWTSDKGPSEEYLDSQGIPREL